MSPYQDLLDIVVFYCLSSHNYNKKSQWPQLLVSPPPWPTEPRHVDKRKLLDAIWSHTALWWARKSRTDLQYHQSNMILVNFLWNTFHELERIFIHNKYVYIVIWAVVKYNNNTKYKNNSKQAIITETLSLHRFNAPLLLTPPRTAWRHLYLISI